MQESPVQERPSESRIREAVALDGVTTLVTTCPKDLTMYRDATKTVGVEDQLVVADLAELVEAATREPELSLAGPSSTEAPATVTGT
jgi:Fe-S oxidoreductase